MKNKIVVLALCALITVGMFSACGRKSESNVIPLPVATPNPDISRPEGRFYKIGDELKAEGGLSVLGYDFLKIMIEGKETEFALSQKAMKEISFFNKNEKEPMIRRGTMLIITYTIKDLVYTAESIEIVNAN